MEQENGDHPQHNQMKHETNSLALNLRKAEAKAVVVDAIRHALQEYVERPLQELTGGVHNLLSERNTRNARNARNPTMITREGKTS